MARPLFTQQLDTAFEEVVGPAGASRARYEYWLSAVRPVVAQAAKAPSPEAAAIYRLPAHTEDLEAIEAAASRIRDHARALVVIGMGGSSLSAEMLACLASGQGPKLYIVDNIDPHSITTLMAELRWQETAFLVVSKSGTTVETQALAMIFLRAAKQHMGARVAEHFTVITMLNDNPLHRLAREHGMALVAHDAALGGRFSCLSAVGLIPASVMGIDIRTLRAGADITLRENLAESIGAAGQAAALHLALMDKRIHIDVLMHYSDRLEGLTRWHRQCWAESLGKSGKGTTPVPSRGATDQHSQMQLYLEGPKDKFFTAIVIDASGEGALIAQSTQPGATRDDGDHFAYLNGHTLGDLFMAEQRAAHASLLHAGQPLRTITGIALSEAVLGALLMHFMLEVIFTAGLLGINAFEQPAVEHAKRLVRASLAGK